MYKYDIDYKLQGLKKVREGLVEDNEVIAYGEMCDPDPYGNRRRCEWSYKTLNRDMSDYPCPWDSRLMSAAKFKDKKYSRKGCFYKCTLRDKKIKGEDIIDRKEAYIEVMDKLINVMENDTNWRTTLGEGSLLTKKSRGIISKSKDKKKVDDAIAKKRSEEEKAAAIKNELNKIADEIIQYVKKCDINVLRYDSKGTNSIHLKFDYGMAGTLRISDAYSNKGLNYTFNVLSCINAPCKKSSVTQSGHYCDQYYYPIFMVNNVSMDIVRYREFRKAKYGKEKYDLLLNQYKEEDDKKGFWQRSVKI